MNRPDDKNATTFVITLPEAYRAELTYRAQARTTHGVLVQLIAQAQQSLVLAAPYLRASALLHDTNLATALRGALERDVSIDLASTNDSLQGLDLATLQVTGRGRLRLFQPAANLEAENILGSHAKFYVADGARAYIGSANLTHLGLNQHLEMGLMLEGEVARQVHQFWKYLRGIGFFLEVET